MSTLVEKLKNIVSRNTWQITAEDRETCEQALAIAMAAENKIEREASETEKQESARQQALAQMASISQMVSALTCDYDRLQELREERENLQADITGAKTDDEVNASNSAMIEWQSENAEELEELEKAAGDYENEDEASQRIQEDPLSIEVRSSWQAIGETLEPSEFMILLCTGGPACRIVGELDQYNRPCRAWLEYQDWFTPWVELVDGVSHSDILTYCQQFYFGE